MRAIGLIPTGGADSAPVRDDAPAPVARCGVVLRASAIYQVGAGAKSRLVVTGHPADDPALKFAVAAALSVAAGSLDLCSEDEFLGAPGPAVPVFDLALLPARRRAEAKVVVPPDVIEPGVHQAAWVDISTGMALVVEGKALWGVEASHPDALLAPGRARTREILTLAADGVVICDGALEPGLQTEGFREYWLSGAENFAGILKCRRAVDGTWTASLSLGAEPGVLSAAAVSMGIMPPAGQSALPEGLQRLVPERLQYWKAQGPQAKAMRDELVNSGALASDKVCFVAGGEPAAVTLKCSLVKDSVDLVTGQRFSLLEQTWRKACGEVTRKRLHLIVGDGSEAHRLELAQMPGVETVEASITTADPAWLDAVGKFAPGATVGSDVVNSSKTLSSEISIVDRGVVEEADVEEGAWTWAFKGSTLNGVYAVLPEEIGATACRVERRAPGTLVAKASDVKAPSLVEENVREEAPHEMTSLSRDVRLIKSGTERFVFGIVLEPNDGVDDAPFDPDLQKDVYSASTIRDSAHGFMQKFRQIGLQHKSSVSDKVAILESYIAPCSFDLSGYTVRKGTWLLALRVMDDDLWKAVESGAITGFSIGGSGNRIPLN